MMEAVYMDNDIRHKVHPSLPRIPRTSSSKFRIRAQHTQLRILWEYLHHEPQS